MSGLRRMMGSRVATRLDVAVVVGFVAIGIVARFVTRSPLWLDEALSVNIASLPLGEIDDALRHDGHPPLYYGVLHLWIRVFGDSDGAVRALSGLCAVATLPLFYVAGRRRGGVRIGALAVLVAAVLPWMVRYGTEARMYALVSLLVLGGWLLADDLLVRPDARRWAGLALLTGAAVLTHYWVLFLGAVAAIGLVIHHRRGADDARAGVRRVATALAIGSFAFVPWLPSFIEQVRHTGTPWAGAGRPTSAVVELARGTGGGAFDEALLLGWVVLMLAAAALVVREQEGLVVLDPATVPGARAEVLVGGGTFALGLAAGLVTDSVFVARYAAAFLPLLVIGVAVTVSRLPPWWQRCAVIGIVVLAAPGIVKNVVDTRTQGEEFADAIAAGAGPGDVVALCPDQLGPATLRSLPDDVEAVGLPTFERPERIDWSDYAERNESADPRAAVDRLDATSGAVWLVLSPDYATYEDYCITVYQELLHRRPAATDVVPDRVGDVFEAGVLVRYPPSADGP